jgi:hypothetical protein
MAAIRCSGRKLHRYFPNAGIPSPTVDVVQRADTIGEPKTMPALTVEATADAIIEQGIASPEQVAAVLASLADFCADPGSICGPLRIFQAWTRRAAA